MSIHTQAFARAGLIGNPSDGYFGKTISVLLRDFSARVSCSESSRLAILPQRCDRLEFESFDDLLEDLRIHGYYGGIRLVKAAIKRFADHCRDQGTDIGGRNFTIRYESDIPVRVGLAGSSAIVTAVFRALMRFHEVEIPDELLPSLILGAERDELGIAAGLQDRVIQVWEGAVFMDFEREHMERVGHGRYVRLDPAALPPLFVAYHEALAEGTEVVHDDLRGRFEAGDREVVAAMARFAELAQEARDLVEAGRGAEIGPLMDANFDLRASICTVSEGNHQLVRIARKLGSAAKLAGSGGAIIGTYDGDLARLARLREAFEEAGAKLLCPDLRAAPQST